MQGIHISSYFLKKAFVQFRLMQGGVVVHTFVITLN